jgi:anti-sigma-K factor RskA
LLVPPNVWRNIENAVNRGQANHSPGQTVATGGTSNVVQLRRRLAVWRGAALATGALAAGLAGFLVIDRLSVAPAVEGTGRYVAVVDTDGREPALVAEVDTRSGTIRIRSLAAEVPAGRSLELWHIPEGQGARSLGILEANDTGQTIADRIAAGPVNGIIAVTVEPEGGSPTGEATGPVVYSGRLVPIE